MVHITWRMETPADDSDSEIGVVAIATVQIPIGNGCTIEHELRSAGLWGIEHDAPPAYLAEVFLMEREELTDQIRTLAHAIVSGSFVETAVQSPAAIA